MEHAFALFGESDAPDSRRQLAERWRPGIDLRRPHVHASEQHLGVLDPREAGDVIAEGVAHHVWGARAWMPERAANSMTAVRSALLELDRRERSPRSELAPESRQLCAGNTYSSLSLIHI